jgi:hypothetical protein
VKRKTLNLVVSPVIEEISAGRSFGEGRRQERQARKGRVVVYRIGVADSIEQHTMSGSKPGYQTILGEQLKGHRVCPHNPEKERGKRESGEGWRSG